MFERAKNFFMYGMATTDEMLGISKPFAKERAKQTKAAENLPPVQLEKDDRKAIAIAALQVFGPIVLGLLALAFALLFITAKFF